MPAAIMQCDQARPGGPSLGSPGIARNDLWENRTCTFTSINVAGSYQWTLLDKPPGSLASFSTPTSQTATITFDKGGVDGTYRVMLSLDGGGPNIPSGSYQILVFRVRSDVNGVQVDRGWAMPAVGEQLLEGNYGGNARGYDEPFRFMIKDILAFIVGGGSATAGGDLSGVVSNATVQKIQNRSVSASPPNDKDLLTWSNANTRWEPQPLTLPNLGGDTTGPPGANTTMKIRGASVASAAGALVLGAVLRVVGGSALDYGPVDLANASAVQNQLPGANVVPSFGAQAISGASLNTTGDVTVGGNLIVNGTTVTVNSTTLDVDARVIHANFHPIASVPVPTQITGFEVERGDGGVTKRDAAAILWDEAGQQWQFAFQTAANDTAVGALLPIKVFGATLTGLGGGGAGYATVSNAGVIGFAATVGSGGVTPGTAGQVFITNGTPASAWTSLINVELTHGRFMSGDGGTDAFAMIGPVVGGETTYGGLYALAHGATPTLHNYLAISDGTTAFWNTPGLGSHNFYQADAVLLAQIAIGAFTYAGNSGATRFSVESGHGKGTFGGGGTDFKVVMGPAVGFETQAGDIWALPFNVAPTGFNYIFAGDGANTYFSAVTGVHHFVVAGNQTIMDLATNGVANAPVASAGNMRFTNPFSAVARNAGNTADANIFSWSNSNVLFLGDAAQSSFTDVRGFSVGLTTITTLLIRDSNGNTAITFSPNATGPMTETIAAGVTGYTWTQAQAAALANGADIIVQAQKGGTGNTQGGNLQLRYGSNTGSPGTSAEVIVGGPASDMEARFGNHAGSPSTFFGLWILPHATASSSTNFAFLGDGSTTYFNAPVVSGTLNFSVGNTYTVATMTSSAVSIGNQVSVANASVQGITYVQLQSQGAFYLDAPVQHWRTYAGAELATWTLTSGVKFEMQVLDNVPLTIDYQAAVSDHAALNLILSPQAPYASAVTNLTAGDVVVSIPASIGGGPKYAGLKVLYNNLQSAALGTWNNNGGNGGALWLGQLASITGLNFAVYGDSVGNTILNTASGAGTIFFRLNNSTFLGQWANTQLLLSPSTPNVQWDVQTANPVLNQLGQTSDALPQSLTIGAQAAYTLATGANRTPGSINFAIGAPTNSGTVEAGFSFYRSGTEIARIQIFNAAPNQVALYLGNGTAFTGSTQGNCAILSDANTYTYMNTAAAGAAGITVNDSTFLQYFPSTHTRMFLGGTSTTAPICFDWATANVSQLFSGTGTTNFLIATDVTGATLTFAPGLATNVLQLAGGTQDSIALGANIATAGHARIPNGFAAMSRNSGNTANFAVLRTGTAALADYTVIGDETANSTGTVIYGGAATSYFQATATNMQFGNPTVVSIFSNSGGTIQLADGSLNPAIKVVPGTVLSGAAINFYGSVAFTCRTQSTNFTVDTTTKDALIKITATLTMTLSAAVVGRTMLLIIDATGAAVTLTIAKAASESLNGVAIPVGGIPVNVPAGTVAIYRLISIDGTNWYLA